MGCKYCTDADDRQPIFAETSDFFDDTLLLDEYVNFDGSVTVGIDINGNVVLTRDYPINYCPMCGRKLKEVE